MKNIANGLGLVALLLQSNQPKKKIKKEISIFDPIFHDVDKAIKYFEILRWQNGVICPHCNGIDKASRLKGKSTRKGLWKCGHCRKQFTVTIGTIFQGSHIPLHKWLLGFYLMCSSKKGISSHQLHRTLGITYKSAWFMSHRIREAMKVHEDSNKMGGNGKIIEADETYWGKKENAPKVKGGWSHKHSIFSLVERGGEVRSFHVERVTGKTLKPILQKQIEKITHIMTDDMGAYKNLEEHFLTHNTICHSRKEWSRGCIHTNTIEGFFSILKRGLNGIYQHVWSQHLKRYIAEFDFRYSHRKTSDIERFNIALKGTEGRRLTYYNVTT